METTFAAQHKPNTWHIETSRMAASACPHQPHTQTDTTTKLLPDPPLRSARFVERNNNKESAATTSAGAWQTHAHRLAATACGGSHARTHTASVWARYGRPAKCAVVATSLHLVPYCQSCATDTKREKKKLPAKRNKFVCFFSVFLRVQHRSSSNHRVSHFIRRLFGKKNCARSDSYVLNWIGIKIKRR